MKLQSIQVLRGFAALCVAMNHLVSFERATIAQNGFDEASLVGGLWKNGFAGVDLFFVISGFIMVYVTFGRERGAARVGDFFLARVIRIYPLWWLFMIIMAGVFLIVHGTPFHPEEFGKTDAGVAAYILKSTLLIPQEGLPILGVGWTLIHEMYFYLMFGLFLFLPQRYLPALLAVWGALVLASYPAGFTSANPDTLLHVATYPMTIEFILGAFAALVYFRFRLPWQLAALLAALGAASFMLAMTVFENTHEAEAGIWATLHWGRVIYFGLPSLLLVYGLVSLEKAKDISLPKWTVYAGDISFALYLCHTIVFIAVKRCFAMLAEVDAGWLSNLVRIGTPGALDNFTFVVCCLIAALATAALSYRLFERPSLRVLSRLRSQEARSGKGRQTAKH